MSNTRGFHLLISSDSVTDASSSTASSIILFDGGCALCNGMVQFVIDRDPEGAFRFAALQSEVGQALLRAHDAVESESVVAAGRRSTNPLRSVVLIEEGQLYRQSTAALRIARRLNGGWPLLYALVGVPRFLRDAAYDWVARHRYDWFGQRDQCHVPAPEVRDRLIDQPASPSTS